MEQVRSDTIYEWSNGISTIDPIPRNLQPRILKSLAQAFTHRDNPNIWEFQSLHSLPARLGPTHPYLVFDTCWPSWPTSGRRSIHRVGA